MRAEPRRSPGRSTPGPLKTDRQDDREHGTADDGPDEGIEHALVEASARIEAARRFVDHALDPGDQATFSPQECARQAMHLLAQAGRFLAVAA